jgi:hypothetical protein
MAIGRFLASVGRPLSKAQKKGDKFSVDIITSGGGREAFKRLVKTAERGARISARGGHKATNSRQRISNLNERVLARAVEKAGPTKRVAASQKIKVRRGAFRVGYVAAGAAGAVGWTAQKRAEAGRKAAATRARNGN